jgi:hypothetical protein
MRDIVDTFCMTGTAGSFSVFHVARVSNQAFVRLRQITGCVVTLMASCTLRCREGMFVRKSADFIFVALQAARFAAR